MTLFQMPDPLPVPTEEEIRKAGYIGDITKYPLSKEAFLKRCKFNGVKPESVTNPSWFYAPNQAIKKELEL